MIHAKIFAAREIRAFSMMQNLPFSRRVFQWTWANNVYLFINLVDEIRAQNVHRAKVVSWA